MLYQNQNDLSDILIEFNNVNGGYEGEFTLNNINLIIKKGEFIGMLGPSGSGKTTLLKSVLVDIRIYSGEIIINGGNGYKNELNIGYVPQLETIDWNFPITVRQLIEMGSIRTSKYFPWINKEEKFRSPEKIILS